MKRLRVFWTPIEKAAVDPSSSVEMANTRLVTSVENALPASAWVRDYLQFVRENPWVEGSSQPWVIGATGVNRNCMSKGEEQSRQTLLTIARVLQVPGRAGSTCESNDLRFSGLCFVRP